MASAPLRCFPQLHLHILQGPRKRTKLTSTSPVTSAEKTRERSGRRCISRPVSYRGIVAPPDAGRACRIVEKSREQSHVCPASTVRYQIKTTDPTTELML